LRKGNRGEISLGKKNEKKKRPAAAGVGEGTGRLKKFCLPAREPKKNQQRRKGVGYYSKKEKPTHS